jgi:hypothetical protein
VRKEKPFEPDAESHGGLSFREGTRLFIVHVSDRGAGVAETEEVRPEPDRFSEGMGVAEIGIGEIFREDGVKGLNLTKPCFRKECGVPIKSGNPA